MCFTHFFCAQREHYIDSTMKKKVGDVHFRRADALAVLVVVIFAVLIRPADCKAPRSILQACREDLQRLCVHRLVEDGMQCLFKRRAEITNVVCLSWLAARDGCLRDSRGVCKSGSSFFTCISQMKDSDLTEPCLGSAYLKSTRMATQWKSSRLRNGEARATP
jgi:hypothetical protein